jgi:uncharacterized protein YbjT (DUF2867 family)
MKTVLVTGATGKIGSRLVPRLAARRDVAVRALARSAEKGAPLRAAGAQVVSGTLEDARAVRAALDGVDTLVLVTASAPAAADQASAVLTAAKEAGVRKVVRVSVFKAGLDAPTAVARLHGRTDAEIQTSGLTYTILRPPFFMQNLLVMSARAVAGEGKLYFGTGAGRLGMIDLRDAADCAEYATVSSAHDDQVFTLTGPESISFHDVADRLTHALGRPVEYVPVTPEAVEQSIRALGMGDWYAQVMRDYCRAYSENWGDVVTDGVERMTGRPARSFDTFARELLAPALGRGKPAI